MHRTFGSWLLFVKEEEEDEANSILLRWENFPSETLSLFILLLVLQKQSSTVPYFKCRYMETIIKLCISNPFFDSRIMNSGRLVYGFDSSICFFIETRHVLRPLWLFSQRHSPSYSCCCYVFVYCTVLLVIIEKTYIFIIIYSELIRMHLKKKLIKWNKTLCVSHFYTITKLWKFQSIGYFSRKITRLVSI